MKLTKFNNTKQKLLLLVPMYVPFESFVNPFDNGRSYKKKDGKKYNSLSTDIPLGPISLSAYLKKHIDIDVKLIDFNVELNHADSFPFENFRDYCNDFLSKLEFKPDYVGVSSLFSPSFHNFIDCGEVARTLWPDAMIIGGGNIPTNSYKYIYDELGITSFDALCYGEGEVPLLELIKACDKKEYIKNSSSWITKEKLNGSQFFVPKHNFIQDLDEIPFYDYDLIDISRNSVNPVITSFHNVKNKLGFHIMTSRGCPFHCTFCASHKTHGRKMRYHSLERVRKDLEKLKTSYGASTVIFQDDHLMSNKDRVLDILQIVGDFKLNSLYQNGLTLYALDRPMLQAFYKAGVRHLVLPVESGSEKVLKKDMKKPLKLKISERVANDCREIGIYTNTNILIGMPNETKEDIEEARHNLRKIKTNWFNIACASPLVGSEMHEIALDKGFISGETMGADYHKAVINTDNFTADYIQHMQYLMNLELNFVYNQDMMCGSYENALLGFMNVIKVRPDHAFAHYFAAKCYEKLDKKNDYSHHKNEFKKYSKSNFWKKWIDIFQIQTA